MARVDVLIKRGSQLQLIEVKAKGFDCRREAFTGARGGVQKEWQPYLYDVAFQTLVLERAHPEWQVTPFLMLLDTAAQASLEGVGAALRVVHDGQRVGVQVQPGFDPASLAQPLLRAPPSRCCARTT